jgi:hypothetical protein
LTQKKKRKAAMDKQYPRCLTVYGIDITPAPRAVLAMIMVVMKKPKHEAIATCLRRVSLSVHSWVFMLVSTQLLGRQVVVFLPHLSLALKSSQ